MGIICFINLPNYIQWDQVKDNTKWLSKGSLFYSHEYLTLSETIKETSVYNLIEKYWINLKFHNKQFFLQFVIMLWISCLHLIFLKGFKTKSKSFGNKSCKICHMILFVFHFPAVWLVTLNEPWNLIGCFVFSVASSLAGKKMWFKAKNGAIHD